MRGNAGRNTRIPAGAPMTPCDQCIVTYPACGGCEHRPLTIKRYMLQFDEREKIYKPVPIPEYERGDA